MSDKSLTQELVEALTEFSDPQDLIPETNPSIPVFNEGGTNTWCFRRGDFSPPENIDNEIIQSLIQYELRNDTPMELVRNQLTREMDIDLLTVEDRREYIENSPCRLITHLLIKSTRDNLFEILGLTK